MAVLMLCSVSRKTPFPQGRSMSFAAYDFASVFNQQSQQFHGNPLATVSL
jgi:hypothetical protein